MSVGATAGRDVIHGHREIAKRYTQLIEKVYVETGNLWEKYDGNTGLIASQDYAAPAMLGWTTGVYLVLKEHLEKCDII